MFEVRNGDGRLVCRINKTTGDIEIVIKGCITLIKRTECGDIKVVNKKVA